MCRRLSPSSSRLASRATAGAPASSWEGTTGRRGRSFSAMASRSRTSMQPGTPCWRTHAASSTPAAPGHASPRVPLLAGRSSAAGHPGLGPRPLRAPCTARSDGASLHPVPNLFWPHRRRQRGVRPGLSPRYPGPVLPSATHSASEAPGGRTGLPFLEESSMTLLSDAAAQTPLLGPNLLRTGRDWRSASATVGFYPRERSAGRARRHRAVP